jgi:hypothetical protein
VFRVERPEAVNVKNSTSAALLKDSVQVLQRHYAISEKRRAID